MKKLVATLSLVAVIVLFVSPASAQTATPLASPAPTPASDSSTAVPAEPKSSYDSGHVLMFERYKPSYFIAGKEDVKGQISFKLPVIENTGLYFGYSQLLIWYIYKPSGPMHDVNYNPEAFYRFNLGGKNYNALDIGAFEHESNGLAGANSRQWNRSSLRFHQEYHKADSTFQVIWNAKIWYQYYDDPGNRDIQQYRGIYELDLTLAGMGHRVLAVNDLTFRIFSGGHSTVDPTHGGQEIDWRFMGPRKLLVPIFLQLYHGYGENLLDYKHKQWMLRAGIGF